MNDRQLADRIGNIGDGLIQHAQETGQKKGAGRRLFFSALAATAVFCLVFFGVSLLRSRDNDDLVSVTAYAMTKGDDGTLCLTGADTVDSLSQQYWGGYVDTETGTLYVGLDFEFGEEDLTELELATEEGFFVRQGIAATGDADDKSRHFQTGESFEVVGKTMILDKESLNEYLYFWAVNAAASSLLPDNLLFQAKATLANGKTVEREIPVDLYKQVITFVRDMNLVYVEPSILQIISVPEDDPANEKMRVGALVDLNGDGSDELLLHYPRDYQGAPYICCQVWSTDNGRLLLAVDKRLYMWVGGAGYGGIARAETEDGPRLCIWYSKSHSGDAEYYWDTEEFLLYNCDDLSLTDSYYFEYARERGAMDNVPVIYHGTNFDYTFLHNGEAMTEEEFLSVRSDMLGNLENLVGVPPGAYNESYDVQPIGQSMQSLLDSLAEQHEGIE